MDDGRYVYLRGNRTRRAPTGVRVWLGKPGTQLHTWEVKLRRQIENVAWIGQLALSEEEFADLSRSIQTEAQGLHCFTKVVEAQPRLVPAAVFITTMVFAAGYSQEDADEFWMPYLRDVWGVDNTQAFMTRCRKRFISAVAELEQCCNMVFPRSSEGDIVAPIYRHALLPRYVQDDFATWIRSKWREILPLADSPRLLISELQEERTLVYLPQRLQAFIHGKDTKETAADLIADMAAAISLHINQGESAESISERLAATPIKQELWAEIAQEFTQLQTGASTPLRLSQPRLDWVWNLDEGELALRVQNIVLPADRSFQGEPDRLIWVDQATMRRQTRRLRSKLRLGACRPENG